MAKTIALVVAAGRGLRFGAELPKQYLAVAGRPVLYHGAAAFAKRLDLVVVRAEQLAQQLLGVAAQGGRRMVV